MVCAVGIPSLGHVLRSSVKQDLQSWHSRIYWLEPVTGASGDEYTLFRPGAISHFAQYDGQF